MTRGWARWALIGAVALLIALALALLLRPRPVEVVVDAVSVGPIAEEVSDQGEARVREAYVVSAPVAGRLERIDLHVGDRVTAGSTLITRIHPANPGLLDPRARAQAQATIAAAQAAITAAQAQRDQLIAEERRAEAELVRMQRLAAGGFATRQVLETAEAHARSARAAVQAGAAQIEARRSELAAARAALIGPESADGRTVTVRAPAGGHVTRVLQESERSVAAGEPLLEISDSSGLEAAIEFTSQDAVRIVEGMPAEVYDWGGPGVLSAIVRRVEPRAFTRVSPLGVEERRVLVFLQFTGDPAARSRLGLGYRVWGRVILRREARAVNAPLGALVRDGGGWAVYRVDGGRARLTPVEVGAFTHDRVEIRRGLAEGQPVVVFPSDLVRDGVNVRVRTETTRGSRQ